MKYDCASVPDIKYDDKPNVDGYKSIRNAFAVAIWKKMSTNKTWTGKYLKEKHIQKAIKEEKSRFKDGVEQTISWLNKMGVMEDE